MRVPNDELVAVSDKFTELELDVVAIYHYHEFGLAFMTFEETEEDRPIYIHFSHVVEQDPSLLDAPGPPGSIVLRAVAKNGELTGWTYFEGYSDSELTNVLESGQIDEMYQMVKEEFQTRAPETKFSRLLGWIFP